MVRQRLTRPAPLQQLFIDSVIEILNYFTIQADLDMPDLLDTPLDSPDTDMEVMSSGALSRQYSRDAATSTVSIQGSGNHYHACASDDYDDVGFDPSILPPPDPWIDSVTDDSLDVNFNSSAILEVCGSIFTDRSKDVRDMNAAFMFLQMQSPCQKYCFHSLINSSHLQMLMLSATVKVSLMSIFILKMIEMTGIRDHLGQIIWLKSVNASKEHSRQIEIWLLKQLWRR